MRRDWDTKGTGQPLFCCGAVHFGVFELSFILPLHLFSMSGMLCGSLTSKKKKKKMMYITSRNAGSY